MTQRLSRLMSSRLFPRFTLGLTRQQKWMNLPIVRTFLLFSLVVANTH
jgi:hypothetical protein